MEGLNAVIQSLLSQLELDERLIDERKSFLQLEQEDEALLAALHEPLTNARGQFIEDFYDHLLSFPAMRNLLQEDEALAHVKHKQSDYFNRLTAGQYDLDYFIDRLRVGLAHQRIGLETPWYLGAYCRYLTGLLPEIWRISHGDSKQTLATISALLKIVFLDMGLALDTYFHADRQSILGLKHYAENIVCSVPAGLLVLSSNLEVLSANRFVDQLFDVAHESLVGRVLSDVMEQPELVSIAADVLKSGVTQTNIRLSATGGSGEPRQFRASITPIESGIDEGMALSMGRLSQARLLLVLEEITEQEQLRALQQRSENRTRTILENVADGIITIDEQGRIESFNRAAEIIFGYRAAEVLGRNVNMLMPDRLRKEHDRYLADFRSTGEASCLGLGFREVEGLRKDGSVFAMELSTSEMMQGDDRLFIGVVRDITDRKHVEAQLDYLAHHDVLTDLPNRMLFMDRLQNYIGRASRRNNRLGIAFIDLDRFKHINDTLGHDAGDELLQIVAARFAHCLRKEDTVARLGGDEFALLLEDLRSSEDAIPVMEKIMSSMTDPFELSGREYFLTTSVGIAVYPDDGAMADTLLKNADVAMYQAKQEGGNRYRFFTADMNARAVERLSLENRLRRAVDQNDFVLHYQPKVDMVTGQVIGVEALLRWKDGGQGLVMPDNFIPLLEETGMIVPAGRWVINEVCQQLCHWNAQGVPPIRVAINISGYQFRNEDLASDFSAIIREHGIAAERLEMELTESVIMDDVNGMKNTLARLKDSGVHISIDDFGTGYSSLAYLKRFPIDSLKIDRTFIQDICNDADDAAIVSAIIAMSHHLNLRVVAEGVETDSQFAYLRSQGCDEIQGFLLYSPEPADQLSRRLLQA